MPLPGASMSPANLVVLYNILKKEEVEK